MFKKITLITLSLLTLLHSFPAHALNLADYNSEEELRQAIVGDSKWIEQFPNGLLNFLGTQFEVSESNDNLEIPIVRQGGTNGKISVEIKAINISAKYGEDYVIRISKNSKKNEIPENTAAIPLIETVENNTTINISEYSSQEKNDDERAPEPDEDESTPQSDNGDDTSPQPNGEDDPVPPQADEDETASQTDDDESESEPQTDDEGEPEPQTDDEGEPEPQTDDEGEPEPQTDDEGEPEPLSDSVENTNDKQLVSLRRAREDYLGEKSDRPSWKEADAETVEELKSEYDAFLYDIPGNDATIEFLDGEYIKYIYIVPLSDKLSEGEEQVMLSLSNPSGGASRGEFYMSYVNIVDKEPPESPEFEIASSSLSAGGDIATVTVRRTAGIYQYSSVMVGTESDSAAAGVDYEPGLCELFFTPGITEQSVAVNINDNPRRDKDMQFTVALDREDGNVNPDKAEAVITLPANEEKQATPVPSLMTLDSSSNKVYLNDIITWHGYSDKKGTWTIDGKDFKFSSFPLNPMYTNQTYFEDGLKYDLFYYTLRGNYLPLNLGGVNSISFNLYRTGNTTGGACFSFDRANNLSSGTLPPSLQPKLHKYYKKFVGYYGDIYNTPVLDADTWKNAKEIVFTASSGNTISLADFRKTTLNLKEFSINILPGNSFKKKQYTITNGKQSEGIVFKEYNPGELYVKAIHSFVGNEQTSPEEPKVYVSDRIEFGLRYNKDNPKGKYAKFTGIEIKNGTNWIHFPDTELSLDNDFFLRPGVIDAIYNGSIEMRPVFEQIPANFVIAYASREDGRMLNLPNMKISLVGQEVFKSTGTLFAGDKFVDLQAQPAILAMRPTWTSYGSNGSYVYTIPLYLTPHSIITLDSYSNKTIEYVLNNKINKLSLSFGTQMQVTANPNVYKHGVEQPTYKLDGTSYEWSELVAEMEKAWDDPSLNPVLDMEWNYVFDAAFPHKNERDKFGEPHKSYLRVFPHEYETPRAEYEILYTDGSFKFSGKPKDLGWEPGDYATIYIEGSKKLEGTNIFMRTPEVVVDFLSSTRDGIIVTPPDTDNYAPYYVGGIQDPIIIDNSDPLNNYKMQAITSPGFMSTWQDKSPDLNGDGQYDDKEYEKVLDRIKDFGFADEHDTKIAVLDDKMYNGNFFSYIPGFFNPSKIYYSIERKRSSTTTWDVNFGLYENYFTALNPHVMSYDNPIKDGEAYINGKRIYDNTDGNIDGKYTDFDLLYQNGQYYQGQLFYRGQIYNFHAQAGSYTPCCFTTSSLMTPIDFHAYTYKDNKKVDLGLNEKNTAVRIQDTEIGFTYRIDGSKAGVTANDSKIRIYDSDGGLFSEARTGAPEDGVFSFSLNPFTERIKPGYTMNISGIYTDYEGNIIKEYPEVRVGLVFSQNLTGFSILSSFIAPNKPVIDMLGKLSNEYDLGMDIIIPDGDPDVYTDSNNLKRKTKTVSFGYKSEYVKKFKEKSKDDTKDEKSGSKDELKDETEGKDKNKVADTIKEKTENPKKKTSGGGDFHIPYEISLAVTFELGQKQGADGLWVDDGLHYFSSLVLTATATAKHKKSRSFMTPVGIPITVTLSIGGSATAIIAADADHKDPYNSMYRIGGDDGEASINPADYDVYTTFIIQPYITLSAGSGSDNINLEVSGTANFNFKFTIPIFGNSASSQGSGGLEMSAKLKLKILFIEKSWTLYKSKRIDLFSYGKGFQDSIDYALNDPYMDYLYEELDGISEEDIISREYISQRGGWNSEADEGLPQGVVSGNENVLQTGAYPHPNTKLLRINDDKLLLLFIEDDTGRDLRNRASLMYSIITGSNATMPKQVDPDGTWDESPDVFLVGDRVLATWSDAGRAFTAEDTQVDVLSAMNISGAWFDPQTESFGETFEITRTVDGGDSFADLKPRISYDTNRKRLMVYYTKTDYNDRWLTDELISDPDKIPNDETPGLLYGDIVNGYSVIAYRYADFDTAANSFLWNETYLPGEILDAEKFYGQRFLSLAPPAEIQETEHVIEGAPVIIGEGDEAETIIPSHIGTIQTVLPYEGFTDPRIVEMDLTTHNSLAVFAYILDYDSDLKTLDDRRIFVQTYNYTDNSFSLPIEIANNDEKNAQPAFINNQGVIYLYWLRNGKLVYTNITDLFAPNALKEVTAPGYSDAFYIIDKTNTPKNSHIITALMPEKEIDEYKIEAADGNVYAFWTQDGISYKDDLDSADDPNNINMERQLFAACTVPHNESDFTYPWSNPVQVTFDKGQVFSDLSFMATGNDVFTIAYARHIPQYDLSSGTFSSNYSPRTLAVNTFIITNDLELSEITTNTEFPFAGQTLTASSLVNNTGLKPFIGYETQFYANKNGQTYYESEWLSDLQGDDYILGGDSEAATISFSMPEELRDAENITISFRVRDKSGDILNHVEKEIPLKPNLLIHVLDCRLIGTDKARICLYTENTGNKHFDDLLNVSAGNTRLYSENITLKPGETLIDTLEVNLNGAPFGELQTTESGDAFDMLNLNFKLGDFETSGELVRHVSANGLAALQNVESFSILSDGTPLPDNGEIIMGYNDIVSLEEQIHLKKERMPGESAHGIELIWKSSNSDVVSVLPNGMLIPISYGTAAITASLQPESEQSVSYDDGTFEIIDTPYTVPEGAKKKINLTVRVKSSSSGAAPGGTTRVPDNSTVSDSISGDVITEGDKLILSLNETAFAEKLAKLSGTLTVNSSHDGQAKQIEIILTEGNIRALETSKIARLIINNTLGCISLDRKAIDALIQKANGKAVTLLLNTKNDSVALTIETENGIINTIDGGINISIPYTADAARDYNGLVVYYVNESGEEKILAHSQYNSETKRIMFRTEETGSFKVGYNKVSFSDNLGWAQDYIDFLAARGVVNGVAPGVFDKDKTVSRAEFITMLARLEGSTSSAMETPFADIPSGIWYEQSVQWAYSNRIINGTSETAFSPDKPITREETAAILFRYLEYAGLSMEQNAEKFKDNSALSEWALQAVDAMKASGIMGGSGENTFEPKRFSSRGEAAKVIAEVIAFVFK